MSYPDYSRWVRDTDSLFKASSTGQVTQKMGRFVKGKQTYKNFSRRLFDLTISFPLLCFLSATVAKKRYSPPIKMLPSSSLLSEISNITRTTSGFISSIFLLPLAEMFYLFNLSDPKPWSKTSALSTPNSLLATSLLFLWYFAFSFLFFFSYFYFFKIIRLFFFFVMYFLLVKYSFFF